MNDGHALGVEAGKILASYRALHAVQANGAEYQFVTPAGDLRAGRGRSNHQYAFIFVNVGCRLSGTRAQVTNNKTNAIVNQSVSNGDSLLGVTDVVVLHTDELFTHHAAVCIYLLNGHTCTGKLHVTILGHGASHRAGNANLDISSSLTGSHQRQGCTNSSYEFFY